MSQIAKLERIATLKKEQEAIEEVILYYKKKIEKMKNKHSHNWHTIKKLYQTSQVKDVPREYGYYGEKYAPYELD